MKLALVFLFFCSPVWCYTASAQVKKLRLKNVAVICRQYEIFPPGIYCERGCYLLLGKDTLAFLGNSGINSYYLDRLPDSLRAGLAPAQYPVQFLDPSPATNFHNAQLRHLQRIRERNKVVISGRFIRVADERELLSALRFSGEVLVYGPELRDQPSPFDDDNAICRPCEPTNYPIMAVLARAKHWARFGKRALKKMGLANYGEQQTIDLFYCE
jgi:hypothetical protein